MDIRQRRRVCVITVLAIGLFTGSCGEKVKISEEPTKEPAPEINLGTTIGSLAEVFSVDAIRVEGYGIVDGLSGTGSSECPLNIRAYLRQYIAQQMRGERMDIDKFIDSPNTAVVTVEGILPTALSKNQYFDIRVTALPSTQTTSLEGGWLYGAELKATGSFGIAIKSLAEAEGPVYIDTLDSQDTNKKVGYILAGGKVLDEYKINLALRQPNFRIAAIIRNKLNERFGGNIANATSAGQIELTVPSQYKEQKQRFTAIVRAMYLTARPEITKERISTFVRKLATLEDKNTSEVALEAIGNESLEKLAALLSSSNEEVRLRAAKCMLNLGGDEGLGALRHIAEDDKSAYRVEALWAIGAAANRNDVASISRRLLRDKNFIVRLAAYEQLRKLDDIAIAQKLIARNFYLEQITQTKHKTIFVSRSGQPRVVLFGAPIYCRDNIFIQSADGNITINAPADQKYISIMRKHPKRPNVILQMKSSFELGDIIRTLCEEPPSPKEGKAEPRGLNASYAEMIALLKQMCEKGAIQAEFYAGSLPKIDLFIKK